MGWCAGALQEFLQNDLRAGRACGDLPELREAGPEPHVLHRGVPGDCAVPEHPPAGSTPEPVPAALWSDRAGEESPVRHIVSFVILSETDRPVAITNCGRRANRSDKTSFTGESEDVIGQKLCKWQMHVTCHRLGSSHIFYTQLCLWASPSPPWDCAGIRNNQNHPRDTVWEKESSVQACDRFLHPPQVAGKCCPNQLPATCPKPTPAPSTSLHVPTTTVRAMLCQ